MSMKRILIAIALTASLTGCVGVSLNTEERSFSNALGDLNARTDLNARLLAEGPELYTSVATSVIEGRIHLSGTVPTNEHRLTATRIAWETPNVKEVVNDIEVTNEGDLLDTVRDRWINTQVRARILSDAAIKDIVFTDASGKKIEHSKGGRMSNSFGNKSNHDQGWQLTEKVDVVNVKVIYYDKSEKVTVPVTIETGVGF